MFGEPLVWTYIMRGKNTQKWKSNTLMKTYKNGADCYKAC